MPALLLSGCDSDHATTALTLDGTWFFKAQQGSAVSYIGEHIILESGENVQITYCNRLTQSLTRRGNELLNPNGSSYYLHVVDWRTLSGPGDSGATSTAVKLFERTRFASGDLDLSSPSIASVQAAEDVCAEKRQGRFGALNGAEIIADVVTVTAPYRSSYVRASIAFKSPSIGTYRVVGLDPFVNGPDGATYVEIQSAEFVDQIGSDWLPISSGTVDVLDVELSQFRVRGHFVLTSAEEVTLDAAVNLQPPRG